MTQTWTRTGDTVFPHNDHNAVVLSDGKVLVRGTGPLFTCDTTTEIYDPGTGAWSATGTGLDRRGAATITLLPNGKALLVGGICQGPRYYNTAELFDPGAGTWSRLPPMDFTRYYHTATLLNNGLVLMAGAGPFGITAELFHPDVVGAPAP